MCAGMGHADFHTAHGIPMEMRTKLLKLMVMRREWEYSLDGNGNAYY